MFCFQQNKNSNDNKVIKGTYFAWYALSFYLLLNIIFYIYFEWSIARRGIIEDDYILSSGLFYIIACTASVIAFFRLVIVRALVPALIYAFIASTCIAVSVFHSEILSFEMKMKGYLFSAYPQLCQHAPVPGSRAFICYEYSVAITAGDQEKLVFNPGGEMSLPASQWPEEILRIFNVGGIDYEDRLCDVRNTALIVDHLYRVSGDCWEK